MITQTPVSLPSHPTYWAEASMTTGASYGNWREERDGVRAFSPVAVVCCCHRGDEALKLTSSMILSPPTLYCSTCWHKSEETQCGAGGLWRGKRFKGIPFQSLLIYPFPPPEFSTFWHGCPSRGWEVKDRIGLQMFSPAQLLSRFAKKNCHSNLSKAF